MTQTSPTQDMAHRIAALRSETAGMTTTEGATLVDSRAIAAADMVRNGDEPAARSLYGSAVALGEALYAQLLNLRHIAAYGI